MHRSLLLLAAALPTTLAAQTASSDLRTRAETTNFKETSRYEDVVRIVDGIAGNARNAAAERFGETEEKRPLPLLILSEPRIWTPEAARKLGRPVVFIMANIHAGEVEGKEASLILARRLTSGDLRPLLSQLVILIAPIYNADGNEKVSVENRPQQHGPVGGVGTRENAKGLDLNRDYMKLDTVEGRALIALMNRWDPHIVVDLHTTNGSYHGYHLTYAPTLNPNADARLIAFERDQLLPAIRDAVTKTHNFRTYYYGNFASERTLARETSRVDAAQPGDTVWRTFDHRPRFGNNYVGLRNRLTILSEAYSYLDFEGRVKVTEAFVEEIFHTAAKHATRIVSITAEADKETASSVGSEMGIDFRLAALPQPVEILVGDVEKRPHPQTGREMLVMTDMATPVRMKDYGIFEVTRRINAPAGWLLRKSDVDSGRLAPALERLRLHGITVQQLLAPSEVSVERFVIDQVTRAERAFQGRHETRLGGRYESTSMSVEAGAYYVPAAQPLARLAFYLLEPESDDGLVTWNVIEAGLSKGETYPVYRVMDRGHLKLK